jgi:hypothetical protein
VKKFVLIFCTCILWGCSKISNHTDWKAEGLRGKVKSMREYSYRLPVSGVNAANVERFNDHLLLFNKNGCVVETVRYADSAVPKMKSRSYYNENYKIDSAFGSEGNLLDIQITEYNKNGYKTKLTVYNKYISTSIYIKDFTYDNSNNLIEEVEYTPKGALVSKYAYNYDSAGRKIQSREYNSAGRLDGYEIYKYDKNGNNTLTHYYSPDGVLRTEFVYRYDSIGNIIENKFHNLEHDTTIQSICKYEYDNNNNWIKQTFYDNGKPVLTKKRELVYY